MTVIAIVIVIVMVIVIVHSLFVSNKHLMRRRSEHNIVHYTLLYYNKHSNISTHNSIHVIYVHLCVFVACSIQAALRIHLRSPRGKPSKTTAATRSCHKNRQALTTNITKELRSLSIVDESEADKLIANQSVHARVGSQRNEATPIYLSLSLSLSLSIYLSIYLIYTCIYIYIYTHMHI